MRTVKKQLKTSIQRSTEFERKGLATHAVNVGLLCGHKCTYCSTPALIRAHSLFIEIGHTAFSQEVEGVSHIDPSILSRLERAASRLKPSDVVMLSTISDAWAPEAKEQELGRRCLEILLTRSNCQVRILTKNDAVADDFDVITRYRDRVLIGLSITGPRSKSGVLKVLEPHASSVDARIETTRRARAEGLRTYGMLCPCLPGVADDHGALREMLEIVLPGDPEGIWVEPVNPRGNGLVKTEDALMSSGFTDLADGIRKIRKRAFWSGYVRDLAETVYRVSEEMGCADRIRFLLYSKGMMDEDREAFRRLPGVVWLS